MFGTIDFSRILDPFIYSREILYLENKFLKIAKKSEELTIGFSVWAPLKTDLYGEKYARYRDVSLRRFARLRSTRFPRLAYVQTILRVYKTVDRVPLK